MNIISCSRCGIVIDLERIIEPDVYDHDTQELIPNTSKWDSETEGERPTISCPACKAEIFYHNGEYT